MRQWKTCKTAAEGGLKKSKGKQEKQRLALLCKQATDVLAAGSFVNSTDFTQDFAPAIVTGECHINLSMLYWPIPSAAFTNMNYIRTAALAGDIRMVESLVAMGAALDFAVRRETPNAPPLMTPVVAPIGSTALVLATAHVVYYYVMERRETNALASLTLPEVNNIHLALECAAVLVMLGADFNRKLEFSPLSPPLDTTNPMARFQQAGLNGKSVKEMADIIQDKELLEAIRLMEESSIDNAWCRCGSRLSWKECHSSPAINGQHPYYRTENGSDRVNYRYSPLALCPCQLSKQPHFDCCGWMSARPIYTNDATGLLVATMPMIPLATNSSNLSWSEIEAKAGAADMDDFLKFLATIRRGGAAVMRQLASQVHPKCIIGTWDPNVYSGILECIGVNAVPWHGITYQIDKPLLLERVKEWNDGLEMYCNKVGLTGADREHIVRKHTATPFGPCGNLACDKWETEVKGFDRCAKCKSIAYCSRECQKTHWKQHRGDCGTRAD